MTAAPRSLLQRLWIVPALGVLIGLIGAVVHNRVALEGRYWAHVATADESRRVDAIRAIKALDDDAPAIAALVSKLQSRDLAARFGAAWTLLHVEEDLDATRLGPLRMQTLILTAEASWASPDHELASFLGVDPFDDEAPSMAWLGAVPVTHGVRAASLERLLPGHGAEGITALADAVAGAPDRRLRQVAATALGLLEELPARVRAALLACAERDPDVYARRAALRALAVDRRGAPRAPDPAVEAAARPLLSTPSGAKGWPALLAARILCASPPDRAAVRAALLSVAPAELDAYASEDVLLALAGLPREDALADLLYRFLLAAEREASPEAETLSAWIHAVDDPDWIRAVPLDEDTPYLALQPLIASWVCLARLDPERAFAWLVEDRSGNTADLLEANLESHWEDLISAPNPRALARAAVGVLEGSPESLGLRALSVDLVALLGDASQAEALEAFAESLEGSSKIEDDPESPRRAAALLRGRLPKAQAEAAGAARGFLRAHLAADGRAGAEWVHPEGHPCGGQGRGIRHLTHRTPLALLALLSEDDAPALLAPTVRWLSDPAQRDVGFFRAYPSDPVDTTFLDSSAAIGNIPRGFEESLILLALRRAVARGVEPDLARATIERRASRLRVAPVPPPEREFLAFGLAAIGDLVPAARAQALELLASQRATVSTLVVADAAREWLGDAALRAARATLTVELADSWLSGLGLRGPLARRLYAWRALSLLDFESADAVRTCPGAVVPIGQEDPIVLTAWRVLAAQRIVATLRGE